MSLALPLRSASGTLSPRPSPAGRGRCDDAGGFAGDVDQCYTDSNPLPYPQVRTS
jgi:hypothetical protein